VLIGVFRRSFIISLLLLLVLLVDTILIVYFLLFSLFLSSYEFLFAYELIVFNLILSFSLCLSFSLILFSKFCILLFLLDKIVDILLFILLVGSVVKDNLKYKIKILL